MALPPVGKRLLPSYQIIIIINPFFWFRNRRGVLALDMGTQTLESGGDKWTTAIVSADRLVEQGDEERVLMTL